jgi:diguanylate cyclase (GGDEF)-like protein
MIPGKRDPEGDQTRSEPDLSSADSNETRVSTASVRDATADERDVSALTRDRAAEARDLEADQRDAEISSLSSFFGTERPTGGQVIMRAARDRQRAASDRARSAMQRVEAGGDRDRAASDRARAGEDRRLAAADRAQAQVERKADEVDMLTGARRRRPGLADLQRDIDRAKRGNGRLIVAYVDVDGLKKTNDSKGHHAGDVMLRRVVDVVRLNLRSYESIVRLGGDEFVCTMSDTTIENVRQRFDEISAELTLTSDDGSITVGFAELTQGDTAMDLVDRADSGLIATRDRQARKRHTEA